MGLKLPADLTRKVLALADRPTTPPPSPTAPARSLGTPADQPQPPAAPTVRLGLPPSGNNLFLNVPGRGRVKTPEYRAWIAANEATAKTLPPPVKYPVRVCYRLCGKVFRARDGFNCEKPLTDLLVSVKVLENDNLTRVTGGRWEYEPSATPPFVLMWLEPAD